MRYKVRYPLEDGKRIAVFDLKDSLFPEKRKVLTLLPVSGSEADYSGLVKKIEARSSIIHPALPRILDITFRGKNPGLVTDCFESPPLERIAGTINPKAALQISLVLSDLIHQLHLRKHYLGYMNPHKIFIDQDNNPILNFLVHGDTKNPLSDYSMRYAAPEYLETLEPSPSADCYSLGMIFYILFTGSRPFFETAPEELLMKKNLTHPAPLRNMNPLMSSGIAALVEALLQPDPKQRPQAHELLPVLGSEIPDFTTTPVAFTTGIIGREAEIKEFHQVLREPGKHFDILVIEGNPGVGKSKLSDYFQLAAKLQGYTVQTLYGGGDNPESLKAGIIKDKKSLLRIRDFDGDISYALPRLHEAENGRVIIVIETAKNLDLEELQHLKNRIPEGCGKFHRFRLNLLDKQKTSALLESFLGDNFGFYYYKRISGSSQGNPLYICTALQSLYASGELFWDGGYWNWLPGKFSGNGVPEQIRERISIQLDTLAPHQMSFLKLLVIFNRNIPLNWLTGILKDTEIPIFETAMQLKTLNLAEVQGGFINPDVNISHRWISETLRDRISSKEKENIHRKISLVLEKSYLLEQQLPIVCDVCWHYLKSRSPEKAEKYLPAAITYLIKNSSFRKALQLFETSLSWDMISINIPENWLTYIKLLLKTGNEKKCQDFIKKTPGFLLNNAVLFRLGCILDSLDLAAGEICPHLSASLDRVFSHASCLAVLKTSCSQNSACSGTPHTFKIHSHWFSHSSIQEKTRCYHQLYRMYYEMGRPERALYHEIKAFRLSLSLGKKGVAARRLLNMAALNLSRDQIKQSTLWLRHCVKMAAETGDMKTRLEAEIYLTVPDRKDGMHQKAVFDLARIRSLNNNCCGSRKIASTVLLEEAKNLVYQIKYDYAQKIIAGLNRAPENNGNTWMMAESLLLETRIWAARGLPSKALGLLEKFRKSSVAKHPSLAARDLLLRVRIYLDQGELGAADIFMKDLLSWQDFLSPYKHVKTRILQAELSLMQKKFQKAGTCINDALRIAGKHFFIPLIAESCLVKAKCLLVNKEYQPALQYCCRADRFAEKTSRPELKLKAQLIRKMTEYKKRGSVSIPVTAVTSENPIYSTRLSLENSVGRLQSYQIKTRDFMAFLKNEHNFSNIAHRILRIIKETFPEAQTHMYIDKNGSVTMLSPDEKVDNSDKTENLKKKHKRLLQFRSEMKKTKSSILFPIGTEAGPYGILSVDFPGETFVSESDYDFIKSLSDISASPLHKQDESPAVTRKFSDNKFELQNGKVIIGTSPGMQQVMSHLINVADRGTTVLLQGESGTGKELLARALHDFSHRKSERFIPINCSALPAELVENELFGHIRGSYTGAESTSAGIFEAASGGTVFLDEISTLSLDLQPRLLRVLENKTVRPLGSSQEKYLDVRVVAATNQDLEALAGVGSFRFDLLQRIKGFSIKIPPLRKRKEDIVRICLDYIQKHPHKNDMALSEQALEELCKYDYPGNVRGLLNIMENLLFFSPSMIISGEDVRKHIPNQHRNNESPKCEAATGEILEELSRGKLDFWEGVRKPFISRDINRDEVRTIISEGLKSCDGSYKSLLKFFNLQPGEYKKFLSFLEHHDCKVDFRKFRSINNQEDDSGRP